MIIRTILVGAGVAAVLLWLSPFAVPAWALTGFVFVVLFPLALVRSARRMRIETRMARAMWLALTRR